LFQILASLSFFAPIIVLFWQDNGLSLTQIMVLQSIFAILVVLLEIPTGYFADVVGRKKSLVIGSLMILGATIVYAEGYSFSHFLLAEAFWALSISFISGSDSAFIFDTLKSLKQEKKYKKIWGNVLFYSLIAMAVAHVIGGFLGQVSYRLTFWVMIPFIIIAIFIALSLKEPARHKPILKKGYVKELIFIIKYSMLKNKKLKWLIIYSGIIFSFNQSVLWFYQPYFLISGVDIMYFGIIFASFQVVAALSSKYAHALEQKLGEKYSLVMLIFLVSASYLLMSNFVLLFSFSFAFLHQFVRGFSKVVITDYINKLANSDIRATILSAQSMSGRLIYALIVPIFGWVADVYTLINALTIIGISALVIGIPVILIMKKNRVII